MVIRPDGQRRLACIVADRGLLELRVEGGKTLRTLIYERKAPDGESRARAVLIKEAICLGYAVVDDPSKQQTLDSPFPVCVAGAAGYLIGRRDEVDGTISRPANRAIARR